MLTYITDTYLKEGVSKFNQTWHRAEGEKKSGGGGGGGESVSHRLWKLIVQPTRTS